MLTTEQLLYICVGWLSDVTGSYDAAFCAAGVIIFLSGLMLFIAPCIGRVHRGEQRVADGLETYDCCCVRTRPSHRS